MDKEILLTFNRQDIIKLFLPNKESKNITAELFKEPLFFLLIFSTILILLFVLDRSMNIPVFFYVIVIIITIGLLINYCNWLIGLYRHKKTLKDWLDYAESFQFCKLNLNDSSFTLTMDDQVTIQKWSSINYFKMDDKRIKLKGESHFFFPACSMAKEEFEFLRNTITEKLGADVL